MNEVKLKFDEKSRRPLCVHCVEENLERQEIGILFSDIDGRGRKPICWQHYKKAVYSVATESEEGKLAVFSNPTARGIYLKEKRKEQNKPDSAVKG